MSTPLKFQTTHPLRRKKGGEWSGTRGLRKSNNQGVKAWTEENEDKEKKAKKSENEEAKSESRKNQRTNKQKIELLKNYEEN